MYYVVIYKAFSLDVAQSRLHMGVTVACLLIYAFLQK